MPLTIELLPDPAANDLRLTQLVEQRSSPLERINILHGSALQRLSTQRLLARSSGGALAAVYGYTPVDLAQAAVRLGDAAERVEWPPGADLAALRQLLASIPLQRLDPDAPGVAAALLRTLTDLREAGLTPDTLPVADLQIALAAWREVVAAVADRTSRYEDALDPATPLRAFREVLGGAPLIVSGIYDLTRVQRLLLARVAEAVDVHLLLVAPSADPGSPPQRTCAALRREIGARVVQSPIAPTPLAPERYFSVGDPTAEADEIARRLLQLGRDGIEFHQVAILHQQGASADDRICAALERAGIPSWRIGGRQLAQTPIGHAVRALLRFLLDPDAVERSALLDWLSHRALRANPLGVAPARRDWERITVEAGLGVGLRQMRERMQSRRDSIEGAAGEDLATIVADLADRSLALEAADSWCEAAAVATAAVDAYIDDRDDDSAPRRAALDLIERISANDALDAVWSPAYALTALERALGSTVVRDPQRLIGGVNVGAATGPARGIRYDAVFAAGAAERVMPAVGRQDPLLSDDNRAAINARIPYALPLQRDRADSERHAWQLMRRAARLRFSASWSRRSSAVGGPARPSSFLLESAASSLDPPPDSGEAALTAAGRIERIPSAGSVEPSGADDLLRAADAQSFNLAILSLPQIDIDAALPPLWPDAADALRARQRRSAPSFTEFDGRLDPDQISDWRPLERSWSAAALETYATCPYRFFLRHIIGARAASVSERPDRHRRATRGRLMRRILSMWVQRYQDGSDDHTWLEYADSAAHLNAVAQRMLDAAAESGALGPDAVAAAQRGEMLRDLDRARRREAAEAREGWRPAAVDVDFDHAPIRVSGNRTLLVRGRIDRIDQHDDGRQRALRFCAGSEIPDVRGFVNGSSFASIVSLCGLLQRGAPVHEAEVEHRSITGAGGLSSQRLLGASLLTRGGASAPSDGERLRDTLALLADQLEAASFIPNPGHPPKDRPNCARCAYEPTCTPDLARRVEYKTRHDPDPVRNLLILRRQRI